MGSKGIFPEIVLRLGPVEVNDTVVYSVITSAILCGFALLVRRGLRRSSRSPQTPSTSARATSSAAAWAVAAEFIIEHLEGVMRDMSDSDPRPYTPLIGTLTLYIGTANLLGLLPGMLAPTADFSTTAALAIVVFLAVPFYGIRARGLRGYLRHYLEPSPFLLPLEIVTEFSRTLALAVRLFGNIVSEELVIAVLLTIAGLLVPVPIMMLAVLTGVVQAYIFAVLTMLYVSAAVRAHAN